VATRPYNPSSGAADDRLRLPPHSIEAEQAVLGGLIAGEILSLTSMINPSYSQVMLFVVMTLVLVLRPRGLLGAEGRS